MFEGLSAKLKAIKTPLKVGGSSVVKLSLGGKVIEVSPTIAPKILQADREFFSATGTHLQVNQSLRSTAQQAALYAELKPKGAQVAPPGSSFHEKGLAIDVTNWKEAEPYLNRVGLVNPMANDKGHFSFGEFGGSKGVNQAIFGGLADKLHQSLAKVNENVPQISQPTVETPVPISTGPMVFKVGEGLSNVTEVKPGPRISTLEAIKRGEQVVVTPTPTKISEVTTAKRTVGISPARTETPSYDALQQLGAKVGMALENYMNPEKNLAVKIGGKLFGAAGTVIGAGVGALANVTETMLKGKGIDAYESPEERKKFWEDVIGTAKSTGAFGQTAGEQGTAFAPFFAAAGLPGVLGIGGTAINQIVMLPVYAQVDTDIREKNITPEAGMNLALAVMSLHGGITEARQIPKLVSDIRRSADVQTMVQDAASELKIDLKFDANGKAIPVKPSVIDEAVAQYPKIKGAGGKETTSIFSAVSESVLKDYQSPAAMVTKRIGRAAIEKRQPYMLERIIEEEGTKPFRVSAPKSQTPEDKLKEKYSKPLLEMADDIERAYKTGEPQTQKGAFDGLSEKLKAIKEEKAGTVIPPEKPPIEPPIESIGEPKMGERASRVFERLQEENPEALPGDLNYQTINLRKNADDAVSLVEADKQKAYRISMGSEKPPEGQTTTAVNIALAEKALADEQFGLYAELTRKRSMDQTRRGQEIVSEKGSVTDNSVGKYVKELIKMRLETLGKTYLKGIKEAAEETTGKKPSVKKRVTDFVDGEVKKVSERIKSSKELDLKAAQDFLDSLACK